MLLLNNKNPYPQADKGLDHSRSFRPLRSKNEVCQRQTAQNTCTNHLERAIANVAGDIPINQGITLLDGGVFTVKRDLRRRCAMMKITAMMTSKTRAALSSVSSMIQYQM